MLHVNILRSIAQLMKGVNNLHPGRGRKTNKNNQNPQKLETTCTYILDTYDMLCTYEYGSYVYASSPVRCCAWYALIICQHSAAILLQLLCT